MRRWRTLLFATIAAGTLPAQARTLIRPGEPIATIEATRLRAYVPAASAERLRSLVARADQLLAHMERDAEFVPDGELDLLISDWYDVHAGYSLVQPSPLVQVELAPLDPSAPGFAGGQAVEHTLIAEFTRYIANEHNHGLRSVLESVFGRIVPNDTASLGLWFLSTPPHQTQPRFWQTGLGVWAQATYCDPANAWCGRGRDPLVHMVWRLDAAAVAMPQSSEWGSDWYQWPFSERSVHYGVAYTRFLAGRFGRRASLWAFVRDQAQLWPLFFDSGTEPVAHLGHAALLRRARDALIAEQQAMIAKLRTQRVTHLERRTPENTVVGAPAWLPDGRLAFAALPPQGRARLHLLSPAGELTSTNEPMLALAGVRALPDGCRNRVVYHELDWRGTSRLVVDGVTVGRRLLACDAGPCEDGERTVVAVELVEGGGQRLVAFRLRGDRLGDGVPVAVQGMPWSPALRPGDGHAGELAWVETDASGSRLVLGSLRDASARTVVWSVRGRILHPAWSSDGAQLFCCADHTGVANAYRIAFGSGALQPRAITNTLGGIVACVPSPDGKVLALVDHDVRGPFLATMPDDPALDVGEAPVLDLAWPAPVAPDESVVARAVLPTTPVPPLAATADALATAPYSGVAAIRPRYWGVSTYAVPEGGDGVYGLAADPLFTDIVTAGAGVGFIEREAVGHLSWDHLAGTIEYGVRGGRSERTFAETVVRGTELFDYTETVAGGEVRVGRGVFTLERQFQLYASLGAESHDEVNDSAQRYAGGTYVKPPFRGTDGYFELTVGYDDSTFFPTSYAREDGWTARATFRHSGLYGQLERNRALADVAYTWSVLPREGHQLVVRTQAGWSDGDDTLQGNFSVGGGLSTGLPRGYIDEAVATGRHLLAGSLAYRFPAWRAFSGGTLAPLRARQVIVEVFGDTAQVSNDRIGGDGEWFTSVGFELRADTEFTSGVNPGLGVAQQLDGERKLQFYFSLGLSF